MVRFHISQNDWLDADHDSRELYEQQLVSQTEMGRMQR